MAITIPFSGERARLRRIIKYLIAGSSGSNPAVIDQEVSNELAKIYGTLCGNRCGCPGNFADGLRNNPIPTLLELLLCPEAGVIAFAPDTAANIVIEAVETFAIIAGLSVGNTGTSIVNGNLAVSPGASVTGFPPGIVNGEIFQNDVTAIAAQVGALAGYLFFSTIGGTPISGDIGGQTLGSGAYAASGNIDVISADLTLSGGPFDPFIFYVPGDFNLAAARNILVTGGATARNIYWAVGGASTLGSGSAFNGTLIGQGNTNVGAAATVQGRLISLVGTIALNTNVVSVPLAP